MFHHEIDGHTLTCDVVQDQDGTYRVVMSSRKNEVGAVDRSWKVPGNGNFKTKEQADRLARYVCTGVSHVDAVSGPAFTVI